MENLCFFYGLGFIHLEEFLLNHFEGNIIMNL